MPKIIRKRDGSEVVFDISKIRTAIGKANEAIGGGMAEADIIAAADEVAAALDALPGGCDVEGCQDIVENVLSRTFPYVAKAYILYRSERAKIRDGIDHLSLIYDEISGKSAEESDIKRENANVDGDTAMGSMLKYGSEGAKWYIDRGILPKRMAKAHAEGDIHIHDKDFYLLTETCCQIDLRKLFAGGFSTGHGYLREPNSIESYAALACIAIQANQNEMHGGQSVPAFDYDMADGVRKTYRKEILDALTLWFEFEGTNGELSVDTEARLLLAFAEAKGSGDDLHAKVESLVMSERAEFPARDGGQYHPVTDWNALSWAHARAMERTERRTYQAMESFVHNLNTMHSRSGGQVPFSSVNYGTDVSWAGRLVIRELLKATDAGLGNGETAIFPVQIFKVREGVNYNPGDPNHDLFKLSIRVSAKRLFPNYEFLDAPFNAQFLRGNDPAYEVATMGCRTRVMANVDKEGEVTFGRGNLSFTTVNLPRIALESEGSISAFNDILDERMRLVRDQLMHRYKIQCAKRVRNYPFLMGNGIWIGSDALDWGDTLESVLRHGTLTIGFIGLAEALTVLTGHHHGESGEAQELGLRIISRMRGFCDRECKESGLNFSLIGTPAEGLAGRFPKLDRKRFGTIKGVNDRAYYTNSFHVPVWYPIRAFRKIGIEAPYHALCNGGHITYVELDGDMAANPEAFEAIIRCMHDSGVGYGSVNHPLDRDPVCGYLGVIGDTCPRCGRRSGEPISRAKLKELRRRYGRGDALRG